MQWPPHLTVGVIVHRNSEYLMVEERQDGDAVFNQPAGHLEKGETLHEAALRETLEETGWAVSLTGISGIYHYHAPNDGITYHRVNFVAEPVAQQHSDLDEGIIAAHWLSLEQIGLRPLRSPVVMQCINDYLGRGAVGLDFLKTL